MDITTLDYIIQRLREGSWVSGEDIAKELEISRTWVWNQINQLKVCGFEIRSSAKKGYKLISTPDILFPSLIKSYLTTKYVGQKIHFFENLSSTQDRARELAQKGAEQGSCVICEFQDRGRGRRGREWIHIPYKSIALSIILRPDVVPSQIMQVPIVVGVALCEAIRDHTSLYAQLKWPNDLLVKKKKVAGILVEMAGDSERTHYVIVGIGINVNLTSNDIPSDLREVATSLYIEAQKTFHRPELLGSILNYVEKWYDIYLKKGFLPIRDRWLQYNSVIGQEVDVYLDNKIISGKAIDLDDIGNLVVLDKDKNTRTLMYGDVSVRTKN